MARDRVPRNAEDDYTEAQAGLRRAFAKERSESTLTHVGSYSVDPASVAGNIENFLGVAQVPIGLAGPLVIDGEHVQGEVYVPLATTEGTLVASYNRGMRVLAESGGVKTTVSREAMQRAPMFQLEDARAARELGSWIDAHLHDIRERAERTTRFGKLVDIQQFPMGPCLYTRFNYTTGDAAGQNMTGRATLAACEWIREQTGARFMLTGSMDTDKKHSMANTLLTRGRRVVAEALLPRPVLHARLGLTPEQLLEARQLHAIGGLMAGSAYNGAHAANALAALFIATGQDVANVAESHAGLTYTYITEDGDYYWSLTLPALIVGTTGGGTGLATQRECLELMGCYGSGKADRLAEICVATVLAGDISLTGAVLRGDWVDSHERLGRNRP